MSFDGAWAIVVQDARAHLKKLLRPGDTVYCVLRGVSRSGASCRVDLIALTREGQSRPHKITEQAAVLFGARVTRDGGINYETHLDGVKRDVAAELVGYLSRELFAKDRALKYEWI